MAYGVLMCIEGKESVIRFFATWGEEIRFRLKRTALKRLGKQLVSFSEGKRKKVCVRIARELTVTAERDYKGAACLLRFEFVWENPTLLMPSDNEFNYTGFAKEDIADFGRQLIQYKKTGRAAIGHVKGA